MANRGDPYRHGETLIDQIELLSDKYPDRKIVKFVTFTEDDSIHESVLTFQQVQEKSNAIGALLNAYNALEERAVLLYPPGLEYVNALLGCFKSGTIAIPAYPPFTQRLVERLQAILTSSQAKYILTSSLFLEEIKKRISEKYINKCEWIATDIADRDLVKNYVRTKINRDSIAFFQYTSGSTFVPKGVILTHGNLMHNFSMINACFLGGTDSSVCTWLPPYHDMGLIGTVLCALYDNYPVTLMSPLDFLQKPYRWLKTISQSGINISGGPNFAYELCIDKITEKQVESLDLGCWDVAFNGAEPINTETLKRFAEKFDPAGFRPDAFLPCYGLAEATLLVTGKKKLRSTVFISVDKSEFKENRIVEKENIKNEVNSVTLVSSGQSVQECVLKIIDPEKLTESPQTTVGEIWIASPSVAQGYFDLPQETQDTFKCYMAGTHEGPFLRTGDLGFVKDGELFVTGRIKDLIIIRGENYYPNDIELSVTKSHPLLRAGCCAAFSIRRDNEEKLVIVQEVKKNYTDDKKGEVIEAIRGAVYKEHELDIFDIAIIKQRTIPKTTSGKLQRQLCAKYYLNNDLDILGQLKDTNDEQTVINQSLKEPLQVISRETRQLADIIGSNVNIEHWIKTKIAAIKHIDIALIDENEPFNSYGLTSLDLVSVSGELEEMCNQRILPTVFYDYPTMASFTQYLKKNISVNTPTAIKKSNTASTSQNSSDIAIIGIGCRFPGNVQGPDSFWDLLINGVDAITDVAGREWDTSDIIQQNPAVADYITKGYGGYIDDIDTFDASFFNIPALEAEITDPQQRLLVEICWSALENAGYMPSRLRGSNTGIYVGISNNDYLRLLYKHAYTQTVFSSTGNSFSIAANRISYLFDFRGPSVAIDTACSSSLVALHQACQSLKTGDCDMALSGGVNVIITPDVTSLFYETGMLSEDGRCKTFDDSADGYVRGEGCGVVVLKKAVDAIRDNDRIYAVISGSMINQDGKSNGLTAPNGPSQTAVINQALRKAQIQPSKLDFIETHGTGTSLGDPVEFNALKDVFETVGKSEHTCYLGSVKTNIGHLEAAAGIAGLIKTALSLYHEMIPPNLHFNKISRYIPIEETVFRIPLKPIAWKNTGGNRYAGLSSFGFGGTNAHVILKGAGNERTVTDPVNSSLGQPRVIVLSAKNEDRLAVYAKNISKYIRDCMNRVQDKNQLLGDIAYTLQQREYLGARLAILADSIDELLEGLTLYCEKKYDSQNIILGSQKGVLEHVNTLTDEDDIRDFIILLKNKGKYNTIAQLWADGFNVDWRIFAEIGRQQTISLPTYPFAKERYWITVPEKQNNCPISSTKKTGSVRKPVKIHDMIFVPQWREEGAVPVFVGNEKADGTLVVVRPDLDQIVFGFSEVLGRLFPGCKVVEIIMGSSDVQHSQSSWEVDVASVSMFERCLRDIENISDIYFFTGTEKSNAGIQSNDRSNEYILQTGVLALFKMIKALPLNSVCSNINIHVITRNTCPVRGKKILNPYSGCLIGLIKTITQEYNGVTISHIDCDEPVKHSETDKTDFEKIVAVCKTYNNSSGLAVVRENTVYTLQLIPMEFRTAHIIEMPLRQKGIYVITGGIGRIGYELCCALSRKYNARLVIIARSELNEDKNARIRHIESFGGEVSYIQSDITDRSAMSKVYSSIKKQFSQIHGIFHLAMELSGGLIEEIEYEKFARSLAPKVQGSVVLYETFGQESLDFVLFFSSIESFIGDKRQSSYAAGCSFQDMYAHYLNDKTVYPVKSVNWGYWDTMQENLRTFKEDLAVLGYEMITIDEGMDVLNIVLLQELAQLVAVKANMTNLQKMGVASGKKMLGYHVEIPSVLNQTASMMQKKIDTISDKQVLVEAYCAFNRFDLLLRDMVLLTFQGIGLLRKKDETYTLQGIKKQLGILPQYDRLFDSLISMLVQAGYIHVTNNHIEATPRVESIETRQTLSSIDRTIDELVTEFPSITPYYKLVRTCLDNYYDVLAGKTNHMQVLFPGSSMELVNNIYKGNSIVDFSNELVAFNVKYYIELHLKINPNRKINILEIGAGVGGTSVHIFSAVQEYSSSIVYYYTDISAGFTQYGEKTYKSDYPFIQFKVLNVENDVLKQGFGENTFDIVIASNVIHATKNIGTSLNNIKVLLKANGIIILNEITKLQNFSTLTFGLADGWWLYEDETSRLQNSPLLSPQMWQGILDSNGFNTFTIFGLPGVTREQSIQSVIVCESDGFVCYKKTESDYKTTDQTNILINPDLKINEISAGTSLALDSVRVVVRDYIKSVLIEILKVNSNILSGDATFDTFGVDSLIGVEIIKLFSKIFGKLSVTILFEYMTINALADYFIRNHWETVKHVLCEEIVDQQSIVNLDNLLKSGHVSNSSPVSTGCHTGGITSFPGRTGDEVNDIAIIGISGRYPGASDLDEFWDCIKKGTNCVQEVPSDRWDWRDYYDPEAKEPDKSHSKWGGFIKDVYLFDPLFFNITPREAVTVDPQERLFLEIVWELMEDAGYTRKSLSAKNKKVGVFVGVSSSNYEFMGGESWGQGRPVWAHSEYWSVANRVSYFFDFHGPSMAVDTGCSSSFTALHLGCESIKKGESDFVVIGGVNLLLHPKHFIELSMVNFLSGENQCKSFGSGPGGFVLGEGVGAVLLKPLEKAIQDGDRIHAVIKSTAINSDGKTVNYSAPNPNAHASLIENALHRADISPETVNYIEAAANGSSIGDPVEVAGLIKAYTKYTQKQNFCAIGSLKSNIGHLEAASGIAALTKVILQMKHKMLAPSINADITNPDINFDNSPFYLQQTLSEWKNLQNDSNDIQTSDKRCAGISSFGAGGSNAHVILEEYIQPVTGGHIQKSSSLVPFTARNKGQLKQLVRSVLQFIKKKGTGIPLCDIAYTMQTGREHMDERLAIVTSTLDDLLSVLQNFLNNNIDPEITFTGNVKGPGVPTEQTIEDRSKSMTVEIALRDYDIYTLASIWISGADIDWKALYSDGLPNHISLPHYPFARDFYKVGHEINEISSFTSNDIVEKIETYDADLFNSIEQYIKKHISLETGIPIKHISSHERWETFGIESVIALRIIMKFESNFRNLPKTLFFDYHTISELTGYFVENHLGTFQTLFDEAAEDNFITTGNRIYGNNNTKEQNNNSQLNSNNEELYNEIIGYLKEIISKESKIPLRILSVYDTWESINVTEEIIQVIICTLKERFGEISDSLFSDYNTISELTEYFIQNHSDVFIN